MARSDFSRWLVFVVFCLVAACSSRDQSEASNQQEETDAVTLDSSSEDVSLSQGHKSSSTVSTALPKHSGPKSIHRNDDSKVRPSGLASDAPRVCHDVLNCCHDLAGRWEHAEALCASLKAGLTAHERLGKGGMLKPTCETLRKRLLGLKRPPDAEFPTRCDFPLVVDKVGTNGETSCARVVPCCRAMTTLFPSLGERCERLSTLSTQVDDVSIKRCDAVLEGFAQSARTMDRPLPTVCGVSRVE